MASWSVRKLRKATSLSSRRRGTPALHFQPRLWSARRRVSFLLRGEACRCARELDTIAPMAEDCSSVAFAKPDRLRALQECCEDASRLSPFFADHRTSPQRRRFGFGDATLGSRPISALHSADSESGIAIPTGWNDPAGFGQHYNMCKRFRTSNASMPLRSIVSFGSVIIACSRPTQRLSPPQ